MLENRMRSRWVLSRGFLLSLNCLFLRSLLKQGQFRIVIVGFLLHIFIEISIWRSLVAHVHSCECHITFDVEWSRIDISRASTMNLVHLHPRLFLARSIKCTVKVLKVFTWYFIGTFTLVLDSQCIPLRQSLFFVHSKHWLCLSIPYSLVVLCHYFLLMDVLLVVLSFYSSRVTLLDLNSRRL